MENKKARRSELQSSLKEINQQLAQSAGDVKRGDLERQANRILRQLYVMSQRVR